MAKRLTPEEEAQRKAEHEEDPTACVYPYPEHDVVENFNDGEMWQGECRRCGAEMGSDIE